MIKPTKELVVSPEQFLAIHDLRDRASMTLDGRLDETVWVHGLLEMFPDLDRTERVYNVVVDWGVGEAAKYG